MRIGLAEDPDILDPSIARTYVGRIVFSAFCDKLFDIDEHLNVVPQLALSYETTADGKFTLKEGECMGSCGDAPVMLVNNHRMCSFMSRAKIDQLLEELSK